MVKVWWEQTRRFHDRLFEVAVGSVVLSFCDFFVLEIKNRMDCLPAEMFALPAVLVINHTFRVQLQRSKKQNQACEPLSRSQNFTPSQHLDVHQFREDPLKFDSEFSMTEH